MGPHPKIFISLADAIEANENVLVHVHILENDVDSNCVDVSQRAVEKVVFEFDSIIVVNLQVALRQENLKPITTLSPILHDGSLKMENERALTIVSTDVPARESTSLAIIGKE